jgi:hypothetical protein
MKKTESGVITQVGTGLRPLVLKHGTVTAREVLRRRHLAVKDMSELDVICTRIGTDAFEAAIAELEK